ncbi:MAG TPA: hypothetical protein VGI12_02460 [Vicinamibacterales bacterium]
MATFPLLVLLLAQAPSLPALPAQDTPQLDRIRDAVAETPAITVQAQPDDSGRQVFRVKVQAWTFTGHPWDQDATTVPDYVRPTMPLAHYEFLQMVTPEAFRASTLYHPMAGMSFDPGQVKALIAKWHRAAVERSAHEEVRRDFDAYLQARAATER